MEKSLSYGEFAARSGKCIDGVDFPRPPPAPTLIGDAKITVGAVGAKLMDRSKSLSGDIRPIIPLQDGAFLRGRATEPEKCPFVFFG